MYKNGNKIDVTKYYPFESPLCNPYTTSHIYVNVSEFNKYFRASIWVRGGHYTQVEDVGPPSSWFHLVLNYAPGGFSLYVNGVLALTDITKYLRNTKFGDGRIVLGRAYSEVNNYYTSMEVDQVEFYNEWLTPQEIVILYKSTSV